MGNLIIVNKSTWNYKTSISKFAIYMIFATNLHGIWKIYITFSNWCCQQINIKVLGHMSDFGQPDYWKQINMKLQNIYFKVCNIYGFCYKSTWNLEVYIPLSATEVANKSTWYFLNTYMILDNLIIVNKSTYITITVD